VLRLILFIVAVVALDIYAYQAFRFLVKSKWGTILYFLITLFIIGGMIYQFSTGGRRNMSGLTQFFIVSFVILLVCKLVIILTMFGEDIFRFFKAIYNKTTGTSGKVIPSRRKFVSQLALGLAAIPFASVLYGVLKGRYNFKVLKYELAFDDF